MKPKRYIDNREHIFSTISPKSDDPVLVVCPKCQSKALVFPDTNDQVKCVCTKCAFNQRKSSNTPLFEWYKENPTDGYFGFDLWLQINCCGNSLWAFNQRHLTLLDSYIKASLRERKPRENGWCRNSSIASRLPKWIKSHKNRQKLSQAIHKLKKKLL